MSFAWVAVGGLALSAYGTYQSGQDAKKQAEYNAHVEEQNAELIKAGAARENQITKENAVLNEYRQRKSMEATTGEQIGAYAARGVSVGTGSPLDVIADSIANAELEISMNKWNAENQIAVNTYNAGVSANNKMSSAELNRMYGKSAETSANWQAAGTLLSSASVLSKAKTPTTTPTKTKIGD